MSRLMSVAFTEQAVVERRKTVTRRKGWTFLKPGDTLTLCRKVQGRRSADGTVEPLVRLAEVEVVSVRRERLDVLLHEPGAYSWDEMEAEGFPGIDSWRFIKEFFIDAQGMRSDDEVTRIEWRYIDGEAKP